MKNVPVATPDTPTFLPCSRADAIYHARESPPLTPRTRARPPRRRVTHSRAATDSLGLLGSPVTNVGDGIRRKYQVDDRQNIRTAHGTDHAQSVRVLRCIIVADLAEQRETRKSFAIKEDGINRMDNETCDVLHNPRPDLRDRPRRGSLTAAPHRDSLRVGCRGSVLKPHVSRARR